MTREHIAWVTQSSVADLWGAGPFSLGDGAPGKIASSAIARWRLEVCALRPSCEAQGAPPPARPPPLRDPPLTLERARWTALRELGWGLRSDREVRPETARAFFARAGPGLADWMEAQASALAMAHPILAEKNAALRLHFVALGEEWCRALLENPTLAAFLEGENQAVDLEEVLAATHPLFAVAPA